MKVKREYQALLDSGELQEMFPELSGVWKKDEKIFTALWENNQSAIKDIDVNFDEFGEY